MAEALAARLGLARDYDPLVNESDLSPQVLRDDVPRVLHLGRVAAAHFWLLVPTLSITNAIVFANLKDPRRDFGFVRLWSSPGWISASWPFVFLLADWTKVPAFGSVPFLEWIGKALGTSKTGAALQAATSGMFLAAGLASLLLSALCLTLPHTPPRRASEGVEKFAWLEAVRLLRVPCVLVLFVVTFFDAAVHQCYFIWTNDFLRHAGIPANWVMPVMRDCFDSAVCTERQTQNS